MDLLSIWPMPLLHSNKNSPSNALTSMALCACAWQVSEADVQRLFQGPSKTVKTLSGGRVQKAWQMEPGSICHVHLKRDMD